MHPFGRAWLLCLVRRGRCFLSGLFHLEFVREFWKQLAAKQIKQESHYRAEGKLVDFDKK